MRGSSHAPEDLAHVIGIDYQDDEELRVGEKEAERDRHRWELDPASAEDYLERTSRGSRPARRTKSGIKATG